MPTLTRSELPADQAPVTVTPEMINGYPCINLMGMALFPQWRPPSTYMLGVLREWTRAVLDVYKFTREKPPGTIKFGFLYHPSMEVMRHQNTYLVNCWNMTPSFGPHGKRTLKRKFASTRGLRDQFHTNALVLVSRTLAEKLDDWN